MGVFISSTSVDTQADQRHCRTAPGKAKRHLTSQKPLLNLSLHLKFTWRQRITFVDPLVHRQSLKSFVLEQAQVVVLDLIHLIHVGQHPRPHFPYHKWHCLLTLYLMKISNRETEALGPGQCDAQTRQEEEPGLPSSLCLISQLLHQKLKSYLASDSGQIQYNLCAFSSVSSLLFFAITAARSVLGSHAIKHCSRPTTITQDWTTPQQLRGITLSLWATLQGSPRPHIWSMAKKDF